MATKTQKKVTELSAAKQIALATVAPLAFATGMSDKALATAIRMAGGPTATVQQQVYVGRIAIGIRKDGDNRTDAQLFDAATAILAKPGKETTKANRRTEAEHKLWNNAKSWYSTFLFQNGLRERKAPPKAKTGAKPKAGAKTPESKATQAMQDMADPARYKTPADLAAALAVRGATDKTMVEKVMRRFTKVGTVQTGMAKIQECVMTYHTTMLAIAAELNPPAEQVRKLRNAGKDGAAPTVAGETA